MRFIVKRTSVWDEDVQPCHQAFLIEVDTHCYYTFKTLKEAAKMYPDKEFEKVGGRIRSTARTEKRWAVDIDTVDDLSAFQSEHGELIIGTFWENPDLQRIEIYDDYRE